MLTESGLGVQDGRQGVAQRQHEPAAGSAQQVPATVIGGVHTMANTGQLPAAQVTP
jgi:hypothetical protein